MKTWLGYVNSRKIIPTLFCLILVVNQIICFQNVINKYDDLRSLQQTNNSDPFSSLEKPTTNSSDQSPLTPTDPFNPSPSSPANEYVDELEVSIYKSNLTSKQREEYYYWVSYKNSFNTNSGQLAKMTKYFAPESETYYSTIYKSGWPFYAIACVFTVLFLIYLVMRFIFGSFQGPKTKNLTEWFGYFTYMLACNIINNFLSFRIFNLSDILRNVFV
jgi:hypothetical protein